MHQFPFTPRSVLLRNFSSLYIFRIMFLQATVFAGLIIAPSALVFACAPELYKREGIHPVHKRQNIPNKVQDTRGWTYESAGDWNTLSESEYGRSRCLEIAR